MKILQVIPYFAPSYSFGGPVQGANLLCKELVRKGHEITVFTTDAYTPLSRIKSKFNIHYRGVDVYRFKNISMFFVNNLNLYITPDIVGYIKKYIKEFDIIHLHNYRTFQNIFVAYYAIKYDIPYILQANGSLLMSGRPYRKLLFDSLYGKNILRNAANVIALTKQEGRQYKNMNVQDCKIKIIPSLFDVNEFTDLPPKGLFKLKYGINKNDKIILYLGRLHHIKGLDILINAFSSLINKNDSTNIFLVIVGPDYGFKKVIQKLIKELHLENNVILTGPLYGRDKREAYVDSDIFVMPSRYETYSRSLREAYACGKPVIASNIGGFTDLVINGVTGFLFPSGDINKLASCISSLIFSDELQQKMGIQAKMFIQNYSVETFAEKIEQTYLSSIIA